MRPSRCTAQCVEVDLGVAVRCEVAREQSGAEQDREDNETPRREAMPKESPAGTLPRAACLDIERVRVVELAQICGPNALPDMPAGPGNVNAHDAIEHTAAGTGGASPRRRPSPLAYFFPFGAGPP
jgi:hypothetical protein